MQGASSALATEANRPTALPDGEPDTGLLTGLQAETTEAFLLALVKYRVFERETDPPMV